MWPNVIGGQVEGMAQTSVARFSDALVSRHQSGLADLGHKAGEGAHAGEVGEAVEVARVFSQYEAERTGPSPGAEADDAFGVRFAIECGNPLVGRRDLVVEAGAALGLLQGDVVGQLYHLESNTHMTSSSRVSSTPWPTVRRPCPRAEQITALERINKAAEPGAPQTLEHHRGSADFSQDDQGGIRPRSPIREKRPKPGPSNSTSASRRRVAAVPVLDQAEAVTHSPSQRSRRAEVVDARAGPRGVAGVAGRAPSNRAGRSWCACCSSRAVRPTAPDDAQITAHDPACFRSHADSGTQALQMRSRMTVTRAQPPDVRQQALEIGR